jgi:hypothetical protein
MNTAIKNHVDRERLVSQYIYSQMKQQTSADCRMRLSCMTVRRENNKHIIDAEFSITVIGITNATFNQSAILQRKVVIDTDDDNWQNKVKVYVKAFEQVIECWNDKVSVLNKIDEMYE